MASNIQIPEISEIKLRELSVRIRPVVEFPDEGKYYVVPFDLRCTAFTWDPKPDQKAEGLIPLRDIKTYHTHGGSAFFKPTVAEVIAQIPEDLVGIVVAFEIIDPLVGTDSRYHIATTRLFTRQLA